MNYDSAQRATTMDQGGVPVRVLRSGCSCHAVPMDADDWGTDLQGHQDNYQMATGGQVMSSLAKRTFAEWYDTIENNVKPDVKAKVIAIAWFAWGCDRGYEAEWRAYRDQNPVDPRKIYKPAAVEAGLLAVGFHSNTAKSRSRIPEQYRPRVSNPKRYHRTQAEIRSARPSGRPPEAPPDDDLPYGAWLPPLSLRLVRINGVMV